MNSTCSSAMRMAPHVDAVAPRCRCRCRDDTNRVSSLGRGMIQPVVVVLWCAARREGCRRHEPTARRSVNPRYHHRRPPPPREDHTRRANDVFLPWCSRSIRAEVRRRRDVVYMRGGEVGNALNIMCRCVLMKRRLTSQDKRKKQDKRKEKQEELKKKT